jgi:glycosyltransferase involved in cell wall biosynthesis
LFDERFPPPPPCKTGWPWTEAMNPLPLTVLDGKPWPKISIVTPSYNLGEYLEETIRSVLLQNYPNLEYIIIDGGSTDGSVEIIKKYEEYIHYWVSEADSGPAEAIQKGFIHADGEWLGWLNSDDYLLPHALESLAEISLASPSAKWITGCRLIVNPRGATIQHSGRWYENGLNHLVRDAQGLAQEATFFKQELYNQVGGINVKCNSIFDRELFLRMFEKIPPVFTTAVFGVFRLRPGQLSFNETARSADYKILDGIYERRPLSIKILHRISKTRCNPALLYIFNYLLKTQWFAKSTKLRVVTYDETELLWKEHSYNKAVF